MTTRSVGDYPSLRKSIRLSWKSVGEKLERDLLKYQCVGDCLNGDGLWQADSWWRPVSEKVDPTFYSKFDYKNNILRLNMCVVVYSLTSGKKTLKLSLFFNRKQNKMTTNTQETSFARLWCHPFNRLPIFFAKWLIVTFTKSWTEIRFNNKRVNVLVCLLRRAFSSISVCEVFVRFLEEKLYRKCASWF